MDLSRQYASSANLAARIALHQRCSTNPHPFQRWVFERIGLTAGMRVLEIACGTGSLWRENAGRVPSLDLVLTDISLSMIATTAGAVAGARFVNCALPDLPFTSGSFDAVIANHMLYHVTDRERGLREIRRVLRDGGTLFAATNGIDHLREIKEVMRTFGIDGSDVSASFTLENGEAQLRGVFSSVSREEHVDSLHVTDPELVLDYIASIDPGAAAQREAMRARIANPFDVVKSSGLFVAR